MSPPPKKEEKNEIFAQLGQDGPTLRNDLTAQKKLADGLQRYCEAVGPGLSTLLRAQEILSDAGAEEAPKDVGAGAASLRKGFIDAKVTWQHAVEATRARLEHYIATLAACSHDVSLADEAAKTRRHYEEKLEVLNEEASEQRAGGKDISTSQKNRLARNREKLQNAMSAATVAETRALDSIQASYARKHYLCDLANLLQGTLAQALRHVISELPQGYNPPCNAVNSANFLTRSWGSMGASISQFASSYGEDGKLRPSPPMLTEAPKRVHETLLPLLFASKSQQADGGKASSEKQQSAEESEERRQPKDRHPSDEPAEEKHKDKEGRTEQQQSDREKKGSSSADVTRGERSPTHRETQHTEKDFGLPAASSKEHASLCSPFSFFS